MSAQPNVAWTTPKPSKPWAMPGGHLVCGSTVDRDVWLAERRTMIGGSDIAALYGVSKWADAYTVWLDKTGRAPADITTDAQARGSIFEDPIVELWAARYAPFPIEIRRQGLLRSRRYAHAGATLDRASICPLGRCIIEVKTSVDLGEWDDDEVPTHVQFQGQWQLGVSGRDHVHYLILGPRLVPEHRLMLRDDVLIDSMFERVQAWWPEFVEADEPPIPSAVASDVVKAVFGRPNVGTTYELSDDDADLFRALPILKADADAAEQAYKATLTQLQARVGNATEIYFPGEDKPCATWRPTRMIDGCTKDFRRANPDLVAPFEREVTKVEVDVDKLAENHPELFDVKILRYRRSWLFK